MSDSPGTGNYPMEFLDWAYREEDLVWEGSLTEAPRPPSPKELQLFRGLRERRERYREQRRQERARQGLPDDSDELEATEVDLVVEFKGPGTPSTKPLPPEVIARNRTEREHLARLYPVWLAEQTQKNPSEAKNGA